MSQTGLHWAPSSFMDFQCKKDWDGPQELNSPNEDDPHAVPTSEGLRVKLPGFLLHKGLLARMKAFSFTWNHDLIAQDEDGLWYAIRREEPWRQESDLPEISLQLAVILSHQLQPIAGPIQTGHLSGESFSFQDYCVGVLSSVTSCEYAIKHVTVHNHVAVNLLGRSCQRYFSIVRQCAQDVSIQDSILSSESHVALRKRYKAVAERHLEDKDTLDLVAAVARYLGSSDNYEDLLDGLLDAIVVDARFGDCSNVWKLGASQQWCVD